MNLTCQPSEADLTKKYRTSCNFRNDAEKYIKRFGNNFSSGNTSIIINKKNQSKKRKFFSLISECSEIKKIKEGV